MRRRLLPVLLPLAVFWAGCQTGEVLKVVPISGGGQITVPMGGKGPPPGEAEGYRIAVAGLQPDKDFKEVRYGFAIVADREPAVSRIRIEDISDEEPALLLDDPKPEFKHRRWESHSDVLSPTAPGMQWLFQITPSFRVYHVTLTASDGHPITFNHISIFAPYLKEAIRAKWVEKH